MKQTSTQQLRRERERRGWSRGYIAEQIEVDIITVGRWERGERMPHPQYRQKLCQLFEMKAQDLGFFSEVSQESNDRDATSEPVVSNDAVTSTTAIPDWEAPEAEAKRAIPFAAKLRDIPSFLHRRRKLLIGLGGVGALALGIEIFLPFRQSPGKNTAQSLPTGPMYRFFDPDSPSHWVNHAAWSPNGKTLAIANGDNIVTTWDMQKGAILAHNFTLNQWVNDVSWSKDNLIAAATAENGAGSIQIWRFPEKTPAYTFKRTYAMRTASWSPDGKYLAIAGHANTVEVFDPLTTHQLSLYKYPDLGDLGITRVRWSPDGTLLANATDDGTCHVWEALTGKPKRVYSGHRVSVLDLVWSPDGKYIVSGSVDKTVLVWEALSGQTMQAYTGHTSSINAVSWSPQQNYIASGGQDETVHIWHAFTGKTIAIYGGRTSAVQAVSWSIDGKTIIIGTEKEGFELWQSPQ